MSGNFDPKKSLRRTGFACAAFFLCIDILLMLTSATNKYQMLQQLESQSSPGARALRFILNITPGSNFDKVAALSLTVILWFFLDRYGRRQRFRWAASVYRENPHLPDQAVQLYTVSFWCRMLRPRILARWIAAMFVLLLLMPNDFFLKREEPISWLLAWLLLAAAAGIRLSRFRTKFPQQPSCFHCGYRIPEIVQDPKSPTLDKPYVICSECGATCPTLSLRNGKLVPYHWSVAHP